MGKRGPKPEPTPLKLLKGNPSKRPINENEPRYDVIDQKTKPPSWFNRYAREEWRRLLPLLATRQLLTDADRSTFEMLCTAYGEWRWADLDIRKHGRTFSTESGYEQVRPAVTIRDKAKAEYVRIGAAFGLSPSDRGRLNINITAPEAAKSPMQQAMEGRKQAH